jgi:hypothetical protein
MSSSTSVVDTVGPTGSTPRGPQVVDAAGPTGSAPRGPTMMSTSTAIDVLQQVVSVTSIYSQRLPGGHW